MGTLRKSYIRGHALGSRGHYLMKGVTKPGGEDEGNLEDMLARKKDLLKKSSLGWFMFQISKMCSITIPQRTSTLNHLHFTHARRPALSVQTLLK